METVLVEFTSVNKYGKERFLVSLQDICLLGETKNGCCVMINDGNVYDCANVYDDVKKLLSASGITVIYLPVPAM